MRGKMLAMVNKGKKKLSYRDKIPGRSIPEIADRFRDLLTRVQKSRELLFHGRKMTAEAVTNAVMLEFFDLSPDAQLDVMRRKVPQFEAMMNGEVILPHATDPPPDQADKPPRPEISVQGEIEPPKRKSKGKAG